VGFFFWAKFGHLLTQKKGMGLVQRSFFFGKKRAKVAIYQGKKKSSSCHILVSLHSFNFFAMVQSNWLIAQKSWTCEAPSTNLYETE
jgi:hypothetical protein